MVRSGLGAATPITWNSATCPLDEPLLAVKVRRTSAAVAGTSMVTVLPDAGLKLYVADALMVVNVDELCSRPWMDRVCVRGPHSEPGLSLSTTELTVAFAPSETVSVLG